jgi:hypothetical protein
MMEKKNKFADKKNKNDDAFKMEKKLNVDDNKKKFGCKKIKKKKNYEQAQEFFSPYKMTRSIRIIFFTVKIIKMEF